MASEIKPGTSYRIEARVEQDWVPQSTDLSRFIADKLARELNRREFASVRIVNELTGDISATMNNYDMR